MIREATPDDCSGIAKICEYDLGYKCDEALVRKQLSALDKNRECVFAAIFDNNVVDLFMLKSMRYCIFSQWQIYLVLRYQVNIAGEVSDGHY